MYCVKCGKEIANESDFCPYCGEMVFLDNAAMAPSMGGEPSHWWEKNADQQTVPFQQNGQPGQQYQQNGQPGQQYQQNGQPGQQYQQNGQPGQQYQQNGQPGQQYQQPGHFQQPAPQPPKKNKSVLPIILAVSVAMVVVAVIILIIAISGGSGNGQNEAVAVQVATASEKTATTKKAVEATEAEATEAVSESAADSAAEVTKTLMNSTSQISVELQTKIETRLAQFIGESFAGRTDLWVDDYEKIAYYLLNDANNSSNLLYLAYKADMHYKDSEVENVTTAYRYICYKNVQVGSNGEVYIDIDDFTYPQRAKGDASIDDESFTDSKGLSYAGYPSGDSFYNNCLVRKHQGWSVQSLVLESSEDMTAAAGDDRFLHVAATRTVSQLKNSYNIGDTVLLGIYEQDDNVTNEQETIEWQVIYSENGNYLLISKYALETRQYSDSTGDYNWATSDLRAWLNEYFYYNAFTDEERAHIVRSTKTGDVVSLLGYDSTGESGVTYFWANASSRICYPTPHAVNNGAWENPETGACAWWLRTGGGYEDGVGVSYAVNSSGGIYTSPDKDTDMTVRPIIWINVD